MKLCRCPICHSDLTLEALVEDDAGRELLKAITELTAGCGRPMVAYLGLFKPVKSTLSNSRALRILQSLLEIYSCSNVLAKALSDTVEQVRRNRRENGKVEPLANHNYLKKVYESVKPQFAVVQNEGGRKAVSNEAAEAQKKAGAIQYIERMKQLGQLEAVKNTESYQIWLKYQEEKGNVRPD